MITEISTNNARNLSFRGGESRFFEWVNHGHQIVNTEGNSTDSLHTYNKRWSKYVYNPEITKTW